MHEVDIDKLVDEFAKWKKGKEAGQKAIKDASSSDGISGGAGGKPPNKEQPPVQKSQ